MKVALVLAQDNRVLTSGWDAAWRQVYGTGCTFAELENGSRDRLLAKAERHLGSLGEVRWSEAVPGR